MPKVKKLSCNGDFPNHGERQNKRSISVTENDFEEDDINDDVKQLHSPTSAGNSCGKKRSAAEIDYEPPDFSNEMQKMLEGFGADMSKTLNHKKKRMEQLTQSSLKSTNKKVDEIWKNQQQARTKLQEEFGKQISAVFQQMELDIEKNGEQEEKLNTLFKQQQKLFQQSRIVQSQRLKTMKELNEQFMRGLEELDKTRDSQQSVLQSELKKEMQLLQKKILMDTQQQEMANVRKSLHQMLF